MPANPLIADDILVVGAGPAGLATSACLRRAGLAHRVVERAADIAASWRRHYDRLHLHTVKAHSSLPFLPWPKATPRYPSRDDMVDYLVHYARAHQISPELDVEVRRISPEPLRFTVETSAGVLRPRFVVVATGYNAVANWPDLPGLGSFSGPIAHTQTYRNAASYRGIRTLVVGCGNSGAEIALDLAEQGIDVSMVVRGPVHVVPRDLLGRSSQETAILLSRLPTSVRDAIASPILRLSVGDLSRWGIVRPAVGPNRLNEETGRIPMLDVGTIAQIRNGRIRVEPAIDEVRPDGVRFVNGRSAAFGAILLATGYRPGLDRFIDGFASVSDERGRPHRFGVETAISGLIFVGFRNPTTGALREINREAVRAASLIKVAADQFVTLRFQLPVVAETTHPQSWNSARHS